MDKFWESVPLAEMDATEWGLLCDGCGKCCLHKLEDEDSGEVFVCNVACRLLDVETCRSGVSVGNRQLEVQCRRIEAQGVTTTGTRQMDTDTCVFHFSSLLIYLQFTERVCGTMIR